MEVLAIAAMMFAGKKLTENPPPTDSQPVEEPQERMAPELERFNAYSTYMNTNAGTDHGGIETRGYGMGTYQPRRESGNTGVIAPSRRPQGQESNVDNLYNRAVEYNSTIRNNEGSVPQMLVGPGVGLEPTVASGGGYHQLYRAMPVLGTAHRLTQLPGGVGPPAPTLYQGPAMAGELTNVPDTKGYRASDPVAGRANATGQAGRQSHIFGQRPTNRDGTGYRLDALDAAAPKHFIQGDYGEVGDHTRSGNEMPSSVPLNHGGAQQGLGNKGYLQAPTDLRPAENRGNPDRAGNPGRMNVMTGEIGKITAARLEYDQTPRPPMADGSRMRQRTDIGMVDLNEKKNMANPLDPTIMGPMVQEQLQKNPLNHSLSGQ